MSALQAFLFGVVLAIAIGPIALLIINTTLQSGFRAGLSCALGATSADLLFALVAFHLAHQLVPLLNAHEQALQLTAALVLLLFALHMLWQLRKPPGGAPAKMRSAGHYFRSTLALTLVNPLTVVAFASFATQLIGAGATVPATALALAAALGTGSIAMVMVVAASAVRQLLGQSRWLRMLNLLSAGGILLFAVHGLWLAVRG